MISAKRKAFIFLIIAFILAIMTGWFINTQISHAKEVMGQSVKVAVAKKDIVAYSEISENMVEWMEIPKSNAVSSFITTEQDLKEHLSIVDLKKGDLITKNLIRSQVDIPDGHRVVWLNPTENVLMDQQIYVGDKVDIIASYEQKNEGVITKRIMNDIDVIQTDSTVVGDSQQKDVSAIKVSITVEQAEQLIHLQNTAKQIRVLRVNQIETNNQEDNEQNNANIQQNTEEKAEQNVEEQEKKEAIAEEEKQAEEKKQEEAKKQEEKKKQEENKKKEDKGEKEKK